MAEITYLLGAGASCNALPMVNNMAEKINATIEWFQFTHYTVYPRYTLLNGINLLRTGLEKEESELKRIIADLMWLKEICDTTKNFSVDTYARKLSISQKIDEYIRLKNVLSLYFTLEQRRNLPDVRYDNFWASILKSRTEFPSNIRIISWNYDFQLELTYQDFFGHDSLKVARETLNVTSQESDFVHFRNPDQFGIFKLNGSATFNANSIENRETSYLIDKFQSSTIEDFITGVVGKYDKLCSTPRVHINHLTFAWEHKKVSKFYAHLKESICNTEILVVIGYSFPFFNRDIDKLILNEFMGEKLRKVYFQAPDAEDLRERFLAINDQIDSNNLVLRKDIKQFTLPNEL